MHKVKLATIMGTLQASLTDFRYLRKIWSHNAADEALLGVSFTGICDHPVMSTPGPELEEWLRALRNYALEVNAVWAGKLGINQSAAITTVKPSGTVSQLVDSASGIHPRYSRFYTRTVRQDNKDPITDFLIAQGVPHEPCVMKPDSTTVFSFPQQSPAHSLTAADVGSIDQLELARFYGEHWADHTISLTAYYTDDSWYDVCSWIWKHFDDMVGISLLPHDGGSYKQAPYQQIDEHEFELQREDVTPVDWDKLPEFERGDTTEGAKTLACVGGACEI